MKTRILALTCTALGLAAATPADAAPRSDRGHVVGLSISPLHLIFPMFEAQAEFYVSEHVTLSLIGGFGQVSVEVNGSEETFSTLEIGGQIRGYFYGSSEEGAYAGGEVMHVRVDGEVDGVTGLGVGTTVGALAGYKWTWDNFFIDLNGGVQLLVAQAEADDGSSDEQSSVGLLLNFGLGWSF